MWWDVIIRDGVCTWWDKEWPSALEGGFSFFILRQHVGERDCSVLLSGAGVDE